MIKVKVEMNSAAREFGQLANKHKQLAARAINSALSEARKTAIAQAAADLKLPTRILDRRLTRYGAAKTARSWISGRASPWNLGGTLTVYTRGIPFFQVAGAQTKRGVRGRGGRLEPGTFKVPSGKYSGIVFRRIRPKREGSTKAQLEVPRINVRRHLLARFNEQVTGEAGQRLFRRVYLGLLRREAARYGVRV